MQQGGGAGCQAKHHSPPGRHKSVQTQSTVARARVLQRGQVLSSVQNLPAGRVARGPPLGGEGCSLLLSLLLLSRDATVECVQERDSVCTESRSLVGAIHSTTITVIVAGTLTGTWRGVASNDVIKRTLRTS